MIRHVSFRTNDFDGSPLATVTLDAADVEQIRSAIAATPAEPGTVRWWDMIHNLMGKDLWEWAKETEGEEK